jgi:hypothetical protein
MAGMADYKEMKEKVIPFLGVKVDEFHLLGYERVDVEDIWNCVTERIDKKNKLDEQEEIKLYRLVNEIMRLSMNDYLNRMRMESLKGSDDEEDVLASVLGTERDRN